MKLKWKRLAKGVYRSSNNDAQIYKIQTGWVFELPGRGTTLKPTLRAAKQSVEEAMK